MRHPTGNSENGRPQGLRGFARVGMVVAGVIFLLNTTLFPCCEVAAAVLGGHADNGSQSVSAASPHHHSEAEHSEPPHHSPNAPCDSSIASGAALVGELDVLAPDRPPLEWVAVDAPFAKCPASAGDSANIALARASPPLSLRFYLRTQRLLI